MSAFGKRSLPILQVGHKETCRQKARTTSTAERPISALSEKITDFRQGFKWPAKKQWGQFFTLLDRQEKRLLFFSAFLFLAGSAMLGYRFFLNHSVLQAANGGVYTEAFAGSPRFLNPALAPLNSADQDLSSLIFSGLMKYDGQGKLIPDLAEGYKIKDDGKTYEIRLKENLKWHDGQTLTIDDIVFTLQIIQDADYKSPLRGNWQGIDFEKADERTIRFKLKNGYSPFPHNLTFGILPKHLWENVTPNSFSLNELNLKPIGSGPYKFSSLQKDKDGNLKKIELAAFSDYYFGRPNISKLAFNFYAGEDDALAAYKNGDANAVNFISPAQAAILKNAAPDFNIYSLLLPRYFAIFFNQTQNALLTNKNIRQALALAIDKQELIDNVLAGHGQKINSLFLPGMPGFNDKVNGYDFNQEQAKNILAQEGWGDSDGDGILEKDKQVLEISFTTAAWPELSKTAELVKAQWEKIGVRVNLDIKDINKIQNETIRSRQYQALLFGQILAVEPDPFSFWHSSQKKDPGLNLSLYENRDADKLLEEARQSQNADERNQKYQKFSEIITQDIPTIFLFSVDYLFGASKGIKGISFAGINLPSSRFAQINEWYVKTARAWQWRK